MRYLNAKRYMPRTLYGRAATILLVPIVTLQLVVSIVFIQRHYEGVTEQMTRSVALELRYLRDVVNAAPSLEAAREAMAALAGPLAFDMALPAPPPARDAWRFFDFSGHQMIVTLRAEMPGVPAVDLTGDDKQVRIWLETGKGPLLAVFERQRISASNPHQLLVLMLGTGVLMSVIAILFLRNQLRPITRLAQAAAEFGRGRSVRYRPAGATEVRAAGNAFVDMRARIERQIEQRTMMLSGVSHDMRTPLTRLKLGLALLDDPEEAEPLLRDVGDMERLLDEFLAFAREDTLDDPVDCDPAALVADVVDRFAAAGGAVRLVADDGPARAGEGQAKLRPMAVTRALENLIGNALRYGTVCEVRLSLKGRAVRIWIEDDGPGIPEHLRGEALKPFARLDAARNQDRGSGVGLGLAIAQDIARRHGGSLTLGESAELGGLRVDLVLPR